MKKTLILGAFASLMMVSCTKNYTCTCVSTETVSQSTSTESITIPGTKKDAKAACTALNESAGTYSKTCEIQ